MKKINNVLWCKVSTAQEAPERRVGPKQTSQAGVDGKRSDRIAVLAMM